MRVKNIWALVQSSIVVGNAAGTEYQDDPATWARLISQQLDGTHVHLVDVSDALAASLRTPDADDLGPMGDVAFRVAAPGDMSLPPLVLSPGAYYVKAGDLKDYGDGDQWEGLLQAMEALGVPREDFLRLPATLALQLAQLAVALSKIKIQAQEAGIPVGFTVGPIYWGESSDGK